MICQFCHQDVESPCRSAQQVQQRADEHVERCERALRESRASEKSSPDASRS